MTLLHILEWSVGDTMTLTSLACPDLDQERCVCLCSFQGVTLSSLDSSQSYVPEIQRYMDLFRALVPGL